jgi:type IV secretion system protein VirD4
MAEQQQSAAGSDDRSKASSKPRLVALASFFGSVLMVNMALTQWVASRLSYHPALGHRWFFGLYQPFAWFGWQRWYDNASSTFNIAYLAILIAMMVGITTIVLVLGRATRSARQHAGLHGTAHWASKAEIRAAGLIPEPGKKGEGVYIGGWEDQETGDIHYLRHNGPEHVAAAAPTRSGKGVGLVIPTCLSWTSSMVLNDRKGELWNLTAGWRKEAGNIVMKFNPSSPMLDDDDCVAFNPLDEIRVCTPSEVGDTQNVTTIIVDPKGEGLADHWTKTAFAFLTGTVLHEIYKARAEGRTASLYDVLFAITDPSRDIAQYYEEMMANKHDTANVYGEGGMHPLIAAEGRTMLNKPEDERGSVLSTAVSYLSLYRDPIVRHHTRRSDFSIMDLMNADKPVSLYLTSRDEDADRMKPLMRLILNQIVRVLLRPEIEFVDGRQKAPHKHRLLLMLDEFPAFGKLEIFQQALAYIAGYGIKAYLIMQDIAQLWAAYGRDETITSNCHIRIAYAPNRIETAEWLSKMSGTKTEMKWQITESGKRFGAIADHFSKTAQETSRPLITPDETMRLRAPEKSDGGKEITSAGEMLVFAAGHAPILGTQSLYFRDPIFLERSRIAVPKSTPVRRPTAHAGVPTNADETEIKAALWGAAP